MAVYVAQIQGKAVVAFYADSVGEAGELAASETFRTDLGELENDGTPLWDGRSKIAVREASPVEHGVWSMCKARAIAQGDLEQGEDDWIVFLVPVQDPTADRKM
jgi:hypothetical protein